MRISYGDVGTLPVLRDKDGQLYERRAYRVLDDGRLLGYVMLIDSAVTQHRYWLAQPGEPFEAVSEDGNTRQYLIPLVGFRGAVHRRRKDAALFLVGL